MAEHKVADLKNTYHNADPEAVKSWFTVKFIKNNKAPKVMSQFEVPYEDDNFLQVWMLILYDHFKLINCCNVSLKSCISITIVVYHAFLDC